MIAKYYDSGRIAEEVLHTSLLPMFERFLIFYTPPSVFIASSARTLDVINAWIGFTKRYQEETESTVYIVGGGVKSGCFVSTKLALELGMHYEREMVLDDFMHTFYDDSWSSNNNFKYADPPPEDTMLNDDDAGKLIHNGCQPTQKIVLSPDSRKIQRARCVWFLRDPLARLVSFYTYTVDGGEFQLRNASAYVRSLALADGVRWVFDNYARDLIDSQDQSYVNNFQMTYGCTEIFMSDLATDFDGAMRRMLRALGIERSDSVSIDDDLDLWRRLRRHDLSRHGGVHPHASRASKHVKKLVKFAIEEDPVMWDFIVRARKRLDLPTTKRIE